MKNEKSFDLNKKKQEELKLKNAQRQENARLKREKERKKNEEILGWNYEVSGDINLWRKVNAIEMVKNEKIDVRPDKFDAVLYEKGNSGICTHGTNFDSVLRAVINNNLQLVPINKQKDTQGDSPNCGEGTSENNFEVVSVISLDDGSSDFSTVKGYAISSSSSNYYLKSERSKFDILPIIVIGDGINDDDKFGRECAEKNIQSINNNSTQSSNVFGIKGELCYQRVNIRIVAFPNEKALMEGCKYLLKAHDSFQCEGILSLKVCTFESLDKIKGMGVVPFHEHIAIPLIETRDRINTTGEVTVRDVKLTNDSIYTSSKKQQTTFQTVNHESVDKNSETLGGVNIGDNKSATLVSSNYAAEKNFSTENKISGGCVKCGCEALIHYHYDSGKPVPDASFVLTDSNGTQINGKTDADGLCLIYDMGCGTFELLLDEGSDTFEPEKAETNNPVLQENPEYARLAGEYFTLFLLLRKQGLLEYDAEDSSDKQVTVNDTGWLGGIFTSIPEGYRDAYVRFRQLDRQVNQGNIAFKEAINKIHHRLPAEVADHVGDDNTALLLFCQIALCFVPVVGQAIDFYAIGEWAWDSWKKPDSLNDPLHIADGVLCAIGFIPGLGDAIKVSGRAILRGLEKSHLLNSGDIQFAIRTIRGLSDGNLVKGLSYLQGQLKHYGAQARALLSEIHSALSKTLTDAASNRWIVQMIHAEFRALVDALERLIEKFDASVAYITARFDAFVSKVVTRVSDSARPKGSYERKNAEGISAATVSVNAGRNRGEVVDKTRLEQDALKKDEACLASSKHCQTEGEPVDMATGAVVDWRTDFSVPGFFPLELRRFYRSTGERHSGLLGSLWRCQWDMHLTLDNGLVTLTDGEFNQHVFASPDEGQHQRAASGPEWRLSREQGKLRLRHVDGVRYEFEYAQGKQLNLTSMEDRAGNRITLLRDRGTLRWVVLPDWRLIFAETEHNRLTTLRLCDRDKKAVKTLATYRYDTQGHLLEVRAGAGRSFDYRYSPEGWMLRWNDLSQTWVEHTYDHRGRALTDRTSGDYWRGRYVWDDETLTGHYHNGFGGVVSYTRDHRNNILCRRQADGGENRFEWLDGELAAQTDPLGNRTEYQRNSWGQVVAVTRPDGTSQRYDYDDEGVLQTYTDPCGAVWQYEHDPQGLLLAVQDPENRRREQRWTERGQLAFLHSPDGREQHWQYNAHGLTERIESTGIPPVQFLYDKQHRLIERRIVPENGKILFRLWEYKGSSETPCLVRYENATESHLKWDAEDNLTSVRDALGLVNRYTWGAFDNLTGITNPEGATVRLHYNAEAEFAGVTNSHGQKWIYRFDPCGRLSEERHYDGRLYRYEYDVCGQLNARHAPDGSVLRYGYDKVRRLSDITAYRADGEQESITTFSYDAAGRLLKAAGTDAVVEYEWSPSGKILCEHVNGQAIRSVYDETGLRVIADGLLKELGLSWHQGRLAALSVGSHQPLMFSHNGAGLEQQRSNSQGFSLRHEWSDTGLLVRQSLAPDGGRVNDVLERQYRYDVLDRLVGIDDSHWGNREFRLNGTGQITGERGGREARRKPRVFAYDSELNLKEIQSLVAGKTPEPSTPVVHTETMHYDVAGRVIRYRDTHCHYDACGRLILKRRERAGFRPEETHYSWDAHDRLVRIRCPDGARWRYRYDAFGRRVSKTREGSVDSARSLLRVEYCWDGDQLVGEQQWLADGSAARAVQWVYEPDTFRPLAQLEKKNETVRLHYVVTDLTGTARELCSEDGEVHWRGEQALWDGYRETKKPVSHPMFPGDAANDEVSCDLRYPGQLYDAESGLYYNRYRYYDPELGQYLSSDPIGLAGGIRPQGYVHNPLEWIDPFGLTKFYHAGDIQGPIEPSKGRPKLDFNPSGKGGFYVTDNMSQAMKWQNMRKLPTITEFDIPEDELKSLNIKKFESANDEWADFVIKGRSGKLIHNYDAVSGPMLANLAEVRNGGAARSLGSQLAIFSDEAAKLFERFKVNKGCGNG